MTDSNARARLDETRERLAHAAEHYGEVARERGGAAAERAWSTAREHPMACALGLAGVGLLATIAMRGNELRERAGQAGALTNEYAREHPAAVGAAAFAVGTALGTLLPRAAGQARRAIHRRRAPGPADYAEGDLQGEGDYRAARRYRGDAESFVEEEDVEARAREAADDVERHPSAYESAEKAGRKPAKGNGKSAQAR